jgi:hypothetical protein
VSQRLQRRLPSILESSRVTYPNESAHCCFGNELYSGARRVPEFSRPTSPRLRFFFSLPQNCTDRPTGARLARRIALW